MTALIIFLRNTEKESLTSPLTARIGDDEALQVFRRLHDHTRSITQGIPADKWLFYPGSPNWNDAWDIHQYRKQIRQGMHPGEFVPAALGTVIGEGYDRAVLIGSECYELRADIIREAIAALDAHELVIGPAAGGEYYLIGLRGLQSGLPADIPWGSSDLPARIFEAIQKPGLSPYRLPELRLLHTEADLAHSGLSSDR